MKHSPTLLAGDMLFFYGRVIYLVLSSHKDDTGYTWFEGMRLNGEDAPCKHSYCLYYSLRYDVYREGKRYLANGGKTCFSTGTT